MLCTERPRTPAPVGAQAAAQLHVRVVLEGLADRPLDLAQGRSSAPGASASGLAIASTMKRCASSESGKEPASQLAQTTPPAAPEKPLRCSASPQRAQAVARLSWQDAAGEIASSWT